MENTVILTNTPTPYRVSFFNELARLSGSSFLQFEILFITEKEKGRNWCINEEYKFNHTLFNSWEIKFGNYFFRFNLKIIHHLFRIKGHWILGSSWNEPVVVIITILKRLGFIRSKLSFWSEANVLTLGARKKSIIKGKLRRFVLNSADGFYYVPGFMAEKSLEEWGISAKNRFVRLPNTPSREFYLNRNTWVGSNDDRKILLIVGRLEEKLKGILNFISSIDGDLLEEIKIRIIGGGCDHIKYQAYIRSNNLDSCVELMGAFSEMQVVEEIKCCDVFCLPSFSDPSPLALVEAITIGAPVLVSRNCGNHYEAVDEARNGYTFDPKSKVEINAKLRLMLKNKDELKAYSRHSVNLSDRNYCLESIAKTVIASFKLIKS
jgi:glycosyltransferase involved in cell wall biosynthesis